MSTVDEDKKELNVKQVTSSQDRQDLHYEEASQEDYEECSTSSSTLNVNYAEEEINGVLSSNGEQIRRKKTPPGQAPSICPSRDDVKSSEQRGKEIFRAKNEP